MGKRVVQDWRPTEVNARNPELRRERAGQLMMQPRVRHLPVVKHEQRVGILTGPDLKQRLFPGPAA
jgi:CBS domain-containing protein